MINTAAEAVGVNKCTISSRPAGTAQRVLQVAGNSGRSTASAQGSMGSLGAVVLDWGTPYLASAIDMMSW